MLQCWTGCKNVLQAYGDIWITYDLTSEARLHLGTHDDGFALGSLPEVGKASTGLDELVRNWSATCPPE